MIIDTSVVIAILQNEPEAAALIEVLADADRRLLSAGSWIELAAVISGKGRPELSSLAERLVQVLDIEIAPVTAEQGRVGHAAYLEFGKGRHAARLNFGDCFAYALAKETGEPLLFKGDDFTETDVTPASR